MTLEQQIDQKTGDVRTESVDLSFGEIANLKKSKELIVQPEYQRLFRWSLEQKSRLIESILIELPIPQIFVIENSDGVYELIDGLQRISSVLQFVDPGTIDLDGFDPKSVTRDFRRLLPGPGADFKNPRAWLKQGDDFRDLARSHRIECFEVEHGRSDQLGLR